MDARPQNLCRTAPRRRPFFSFGLLTLFVASVVSIAAQVSLAGDAALKSQPDVVIYRGSYPGWPWIARTPAGKLLCAFREGTEHGYSPTGKVLLSESSDGGKTWTEARTVADAPNLDDRNAAIVALSDDDWLVSYNTYTSDLVSRPMTVRTSDGGRTWSAPQQVADLDARSRAAAIRLAGGELLLPLYRAPGNGSLCARSEDSGKTWTIVPLPDAEGYVGDEWSLVEVEPGRVVGIHRNNHASRDGYFWLSESKDAGKTWSAPRRTNLQSLRHASPAHLLMHQGRPLVAYADRRMVSVSLATTDDEQLLDWNIEQRLPVFQYLPDGSPISDAGYPSAVAVDDRRLLVVDYEITEEEHLITGYFIDLPDGWLTP